jgi:hypothetical protein
VEEYRQIVQSSHETSFDELVKLYADSATIAQAANSINSLDYKACQLLLHHSIAHEHNILSWYQRFNEEIGGASWECVKGDTLCSRLDRTDYPLRLHIDFPRLRMPGYTSCSGTCFKTFSHISTKLGGLWALSLATAFPKSNSTARTSY